MKKPFIIGFSGRKGSGKNTCADVIQNYIIENYPDYLKNPSRLATKIYAFADAMKKVCHQFFGLTYEQCYGTNDQKNSPTLVKWENFPVKYLVPHEQEFMTSRELLQFFGTDIIRKMYDDAHVMALFHDIIDHDNPRFALINDARFSNEISAIKRQGGKIIRLTRAPFSNDTHPSETALDKENYSWDNFDYILDNINMTLEEQKQALITLVIQWRLFE